MTQKFFCSLCHLDFTNKCFMSSTVCGHVFHNYCLQDWLKRIATCPECKHLCSVSDIKRVYIPTHDMVQNNIKTIHALKSQVEQSLTDVSELLKMLVEDKKKITEVHDFELERSQLLREKKRLNESTITLKEKLAKTRLENRKLLSEIKDRDKKISEMTKLLDTKNEVDLLLYSVTRTVYDILIEEFQELKEELRTSTFFLSEKLQFHKSLDGVSKYVPIVSNSYETIQKAKSLSVLEIVGEPRVESKSRKHSQ